MLLIQNCYMIDPASVTEGRRDILIDHGRIVKIEKHLMAPQGASVLDAAGMIACPGLIDTHSHFRDPGSTYKEDLISGSEAAVKEFSSLSSLSFWKMIFTHKFRLVIMLSSGLGEGEGRNTIYWPEDKENPLIFEENNLCVEFVDKAEIIENALILKKFKINKEFEIKQIHIICWPDHGMPKDQNLTNDIFETMIGYIKMERKGENASPIVVHCSAGVGRTGTLIAVYEIIMCLEN